MSTPLAENFHAAFSAQQETESLNESKSLAWLAAHRQCAFDQFQKNGFPTRRLENWKYTDVTPITKIGFVLNNAEYNSAKHNPIGQGDLDALRFDQKNTHELVFINGQYSSKHSNIGVLADNVVIGSLRTALTKSPTLLETRLNQCIDSEHHIFAALNTALFNDGAFVYVPDNVVI